MALSKEIKTNGRMCKYFPKPRQSFLPDSLFLVRHHVIADANRGENKRTRIMKEKISRIDELFTIYD